MYFFGLYFPLVNCSLKSWNWLHYSHQDFGHCCHHLCHDLFIWAFHHLFTYFTEPSEGSLYSSVHFPFTSWTLPPSSTAITLWLGLIIHHYPHHQLLGSTRVFIWPGLIHTSPWPPSMQDQVLGQGLCWLGYMQVSSCIFLIHPFASSPLCCFISTAVFSCIVYVFHPFVYWLCTPLTCSISNGLFLIHW